MRLAAPAAASLLAGVALCAYGTTVHSVVHPPAPAARHGQPSRPQALPPSSRAVAPTSPLANPARPRHRPATPVRRPAVPVRHQVPRLSHPKAPATATRRSAPVSITVADLQISSPLGPARGLNPDGTINDAPLPRPEPVPSRWYDGGAAPGQLGSAVILGHVDSALGAGHLGLFFKLGELRPGAHISVALADGASTNWVVTSDRIYTDNNFPDAQVYARSGPATLRLVTCGGTFDAQSHGYLSAIVVTARLTKSKP